MNPIEHKQKHILMHRYLDELLADFIAHSKETPLGKPIRDLLNWSYKQTQNPDELEPVK